MKIIPEVIITVKWTCIIYLPLKITHCNNLSSRYKIGCVCGVFASVCECLSGLTVILTACCVLYFHIDASLCHFTASSLHNNDFLSLSVSLSKITYYRRAQKETCVNTTPHTHNPTPTELGSTPDCDWLKWLQETLVKPSGSPVKSSQEH